MAAKATITAPSAQTCIHPVCGHLAQPCLVQQLQSLLPPMMCFLQMLASPGSSGTALQDRGAAVMTLAYLGFS